MGLVLGLQTSDKAVNMKISKRAPNNCMMVALVIVSTAAYNSVAVSYALPRANSSVVPMAQSVQTASSGSQRWTCTKKKKTQDWWISCTDMDDQSNNFTGHCTGYVPPPKTEAPCAQYDLIDAVNDWTCKNLNQNLSQFTMRSDNLNYEYICNGNMDHINDLMRTILSMQHK
jgi:hypothetical protein